MTKAIQRAQSVIRWKPGKAQTHLQKRMLLGHLPPDAELADYETIIKDVLYDPNALVYVYRFRQIDYPTIVTTTRGRVWLVMLTPDGMMETAFPPDDPKQYFGEQPRYFFVSPLAELLLT